ncbi:hypothetical protein LR68_02240 [Anoxybacillus sp. BCO1]|nr:hypothetical protein LR68_02240 [Anoxybacillus sp. BCO1]
MVVDKKVLHEMIEQLSESDQKSAYEFFIAFTAKSKKRS